MILAKYPSALKWCKGRGHHCSFAGNTGRESEFHPSYDIYLSYRVCRHLA